MMRINNFQLSVFCLMGSLALTACAGAVESEEEGGEHVTTAQQEMMTDNSLTANSLTANSLTANSLTANSLTANSLTANSLTANSLTAAALTDAKAREVLTYIVGCALPAGAHFDLTIASTTYGYDGQLGLAPHWGVVGASCDLKCMTSVSACVLARLNYLGQTVPISVRGSNPALTETPSELTGYKKIDGAYYGNIFKVPQIRYACLPPGLTSLTRVCGPSLIGCVVDVLGSCNQVCDAIQSDGSYPNCRDALQPVVGTKIYGGSITAYLK
jgi:hypothetical protein